jgi:hypothetical protein
MGEAAVTVTKCTVSFLLLPSLLCFCIHLVLFIVPFVIFIL